MCIKYKNILIASSIILLAVGISIIIYIWNQKYTKVASFNLEAECRIIIYKVSKWEVTIPYYYEINKGKTAKSEKVLFIFLSPSERKPGFKLLGSKHGDVFGLVRKESPNEILMLYDIEEDTSWPLSVIKGYSKDCQILFNKFVLENPGKSYHLVGTMGFH